MEKFYTVTEESRLYNDYWKYVENVKLVNEHVKEFMPMQGIETTSYYATEDSLYIVPTKNDIEKFDNILQSPLSQGLRRFNKNSKVSKTWIKSLKEKEMKIISKPFVPFYFERGFGKTRTRLFHIGDIVYCSFSADFENLDCPKGMIEMKASEFHKILEDNQ